MAKRKKEYYVEDLKRCFERLERLLKKCPKPPSFKRLVSLAEKGGYVKVART